MVDDPRRRVSGWRRRLATDSHADALFKICGAAVNELVEACPERRDLVHGDLLHRNVLISQDLSEVTAVFSWKCSVFGDFLFDVAWCTFWAAWHPGIARIDVWQRACQAPDLSVDDLTDAAVRHRCYELQIGASHLGWYAWTGDDAGLRAVADRLAELLERGPLPGPTR